MLNTETVLKLIDKGFTHDEIMAMENQSANQTETQTQTEQKQEVTAKDILDAISNLGKVIQTGQVQGTRMPAIQQLTGDDVIASIIQPTHQKGDK